MDDDDERRGRASAHVAFGEATALLAGDALLAEAFRLALSYPKPLVGRELAQATLAMIGGQHRDVTGDTGDLAALHRLKTGALFSASVGVGLWVAEVPEHEQPPWRAFADELGLLFQIVDDVLDGDGYAEAHGVEGARRLADGAAARAQKRLVGDPGRDRRARGDCGRPRRAHGVERRRGAAGPAGQVTVCYLPAARRTRRAFSVSISLGPEPQSTTSTLLPFDPGRSPPAPSRAPAAVREAPLLDERDPVGCARVPGQSHPGEHDEGLHCVVVPERRVVQRDERRMDRLPGRERPEEPVLEEELGRARGRLLRRRLTGRNPILVEPPHRWQGLVERGAVTRGLLVAVPPAVRPLPLDE